jgi:prevent-host-death family protein
MPTIKPISDLRNKSNEISKLAHEIDEPIFITRNGEGDMVLMSMAHYSQIQLKLKLFGKLSEAQAQISSGDSGRPLHDVFADLRERINGK